MADLNNATIQGRLTKDPGLRYTKDTNKAVCSFTVAVNRWKKDETDFINVQAWEQKAEFVAKYFQKGSQIIVSGRIQTRNWTDTEGKKHYSTEIVAEDVFFCGGKANTATNGAQEQIGTSEAGANAGPKQPSSGFYPEPEEEELPF